MIDVEYEKDVLAQCLRDESYLRRALPVVQRHYFSSETMGWIWSKLAELYEGTREMPTGAVWASAVEHGFAHKPADADHAKDMLVVLRRRTVRAPKTALEELRRFVRASVLRRYAAEALDGLDDGDLDAVEKAFMDGVGEARGASMLEEPKDYFSGAADRLTRYTEKSGKGRVGACTPLRTLNKILGHGLPPGRLGIIQANTNVGKSSLAVDMGWHTLTDRGPDGGPSTWCVVHVCTEESQEEVEARYDARLTEVPKDTLLGGRMTATEEAVFDHRMAARGPEIAGRLTIHNLEQGSKVSGVRALLERTRQAHPDAPILLIVDSPDHLTPNRKMDNFRLEQSAVYWYLKGLTLSKPLGQVAMWATTQAPSQFEGKMLTAKAVSETYDKARIADFMLGLMEGVAGAGPSTGKTFVHAAITKNRISGAKHKRFELLAQFGICKFAELAAH